MTGPVLGDGTVLRIALSIGGPLWPRPRASREGNRFLIGWLFVSLYVEFPTRGAP